MFEPIVKPLPHVVAPEAAPSPGYPDNNPKTTQGAKKVPLHLVPPSATHYLATAFADGAKKYGPYNWREAQVSATVYVGALKRHVDAWFDGEEVSADALVHHLAHAMACCAIILDAESVGMLNDDRPTRGAAARLQVEFAQRMSPTPVDNHIERQPGKSVVIYGPQACGKTRNAEALAAYFGLETIVDDWDGRPFASIDTLVLTNDRAAFDALSPRRVKLTFDQAMHLMAGGAA